MIRRVIMKHLSFLIHQIKSFVDGSPKPKTATPINLKHNQLTQQLQKAKLEQLPIHVIYGKRSFTGELIKYDPKSQKVILKNITKNISVIISLSDIDKITFLPKSVI